MTDTRDSPEQADFRASVRAFVEREIAQHVGAWDEAGEFPAEGGRGAEELARAVVACASAPNPAPAFLYPDEATLWDKAETVARRVYRAKGLVAGSKVRAQLQKLQDQGFGHLPVCIAKTPYSWGTDPNQRGAIEGHEIDVREVRLAAGAEFVVLVCGDLMTMPGLPALPSAAHIDVDDDGRIVGLF